MAVVVRFTPRQQSKARPILLRHSPGMVLPNRVYVLTAEAVERLSREGIGFTVLCRDDNPPSTHGVLDGKRI